MAFFDFAKTIFKNPMGNTKAGTWNVLPAVLTTWSDLIQLHNQSSPDMYALYKQQAQSYLDTARKNAELLKKQGEIALRNLMYKEKLERANDVLRVAASNSNIGGTHLDVVIRKEKIRKMNEMALRANTANQISMEMDNGYRQAGQTYGAMYQQARSVKWGVLNAILKGIGTYTSLTTRDAKVQQAQELSQAAFDTLKNKDAAQDLYEYGGIVPTRVTPGYLVRKIMSNDINPQVPESLKLSGDNNDYSNTSSIINNSNKYYANNIEIV